LSVSAPMLAGVDMGRVNRPAGGTGGWSSGSPAATWAAGWRRGDAAARGRAGVGLGTLRRALNQAFAAVPVGDADAAGRAMEQIIEDSRIELERATGVPE
jgi:hypothetical protein